MADASRANTRPGSASIARADVVEEQLGAFEFLVAMSGDPRA